MSILGILKNDVGSENLVIKMFHYHGNKTENNKIKKHLLKQYVLIGKR
jgi:hypothetical protein